MSISNKLIYNTLIYSIGNLGSKFLTFLMVPLYSFFLTRSELGFYDVLLTSTTLLVPIITLQISEACYRWLMESESNFNRQIETVTNGLALVIINIITFILLYSIFIQFIVVRYSTYFLLILILSSIIPFLQQSIRGLGDNRSFSFSGLLSGITLLVFSVIYLYVLRMGLEGLLIATILSNCITVIYLMYKINIPKLFSIGELSRNIIKDMINYAWPLIPNAVSWWMINASNRFLIVIFLNVDLNGIFAIANRFPSIILIVNTIFMLAWQDQVIVEKSSEDKIDYGKIFNLFIRMEFSIVFILTASSKYVVKLLVDPKFYESWKYMPILYIAVAFSSFCSFLGTGYVRERKTKGIFYTTVIGATVNLLTSYLLITKIGLYGPAIGTLLGFVSVWVFRVYQTKDFFPVKVDRALLSLLLIFTFIYYCLAVSDDSRLDFVSIISALLLGIYLNREIVATFLKYVRGKILTSNKKEIVY